MENTLKSKDFEKLVDIYEKNANARPERWVSFNRLIISSGVNELILKADQVKKELIIKEMQVNKEKEEEEKVEIKTINFLKKYAQENGFEKIVVESFIREEIKKLLNTNDSEETNKESFERFELFIR